MTAWLLALTVLVQTGQEAGTVEAFRAERRAKARAQAASSAASVDFIEIDRGGRADTPANEFIVRLATASNAERNARIRTLYEQRSRLAESQPIPTKAQQKRERERIDESIKRLANPTTALCRSGVQPPGLNDSAYIGKDHFRVRVFDIAGEDEMLVEVFGRVLGTGQRTYWLKGVPTDGLIDGGRVPLEGWFAATGAKTYPTAIGGSNTVLLLEPLDLLPHADLFTRRRDIRTWKTDDGRVIEGVVLFYEHGSVTLCDMEMRKTKLKLHELSDADRDHLEAAVGAPGRRVTR